jgi:hypothetical protein
MSSLFNFVFTCIWLVSLGIAAADVFVLKTGGQIEGILLGEDAAGYRVEVNFSQGIKDERIIPKDEIATIKRTAAASGDFAKISKFTPAPDLLSAQEYDRRISEVEKFLNNSPIAEQASQARVILATLKQEANEVLSGSVKMYGKMVAAEDFKLDAYDMDARVSSVRIERLIAAGAYTSALRAFVQFEKDYSKSEVYRNMLPRIRQVILASASDVDQMLATLDSRLKEKEMGLQRMSAVSRRDAEQAIREEDADLAAIIKSEKAAKIGWLTVDFNSKASMEEYLTFAKQEEARLAALSAQKVPDGGRIFRDALRLIRSADKNSPSIASAIEMVKNAMLPERYIALLQAEANTK